MEFRFYKWGEEIEDSKYITMVCAYCKKQYRVYWDLQDTTHCLKEYKKEVN